MDVIDSIRYIAEHYGLEPQKLKAIEEMAELTKALLKDDKENIIEEIADVKIMVAQLEHLYDAKDEVEWMMHKKIKRQIGRIEGEMA